MTLNEQKNRILDNPFERETLELLMTGMGPIRHVNKDKSNYVQSLSDFANDAMDRKLKELIRDEGRWHFEFFHSHDSVRHHTDKIKGNHGGLGCIIPLQWHNQSPATIMYDYWEYDQRIMYSGNNKCSYVETKKEVKLDLDSLNETLVFEWSEDKILIFDVYQLHSARKFKDAWKEFLIGFLV